MGYYIWDKGSRAMTRYKNSVAEPQGHLSVLVRDQVIPGLAVTASGFCWVSALLSDLIMG